MAAKKLGKAKSARTVRKHKEDEDKGREVGHSRQEGPDRDANRSFGKPPQFYKKYMKKDKAAAEKRAKASGGFGNKATYGEEVENITEISSKKLMDASKAAEKARGMRAAAGDTEGSKKALAQGKKFGDAGRARKAPSGSYKESADRMKAKMIQFTKDHDNILAGKQPI